MMSSSTNTKYLPDVRTILFGKDRRVKIKC